MAGMPQASLASWNHGAHSAICQSRPIADEMCHTAFVSPIEQYSQRLTEHKARLAHLDKLHARLGTARLLLGASFLLIAWMCWGPWAIALPWLWLPVGGFIVALAYHQRVRMRRTQAQRAVSLYEDGLARIQDQWSGKGTTDRRFETPHHIYADDLDLFGPDSLYQLLCAARTQMGENILAAWLLAPAERETIRARQASVAELRDRLNLRESLAIEGDSVRTALHPHMLDAWA